MIRVYTDMAADMFHIGHLNLIKRAKEMGDYLIVGIHSDEDIEKYKRLPIIPEQDRYEIVKSCKYVDEVIESAPLVISKDFIKKYCIDFVVRGDDITPELLRQQADPISMGVMKYVPRTKNVSTTSIVQKIKNEE
jgi:ethanolamine-phosphate cytidylyltransferase